MDNKDKEIWSSYARGLSAVVKKPRKAAAAKPAAEKETARKMAAKETFVLHSPRAQPVKKPTVKLERRREKRLRDGDLDMDAKLDLHGMTQVEAFDALAAFMRRAAKNNKRNLLIITGKGRPSPDGKSAGVLRGNLEAWLQQLPESASILAVRTAAPKHGGNGAFYVVMRKKI